LQRLVDLESDAFECVERVMCFACVHERRARGNVDTPFLQVLAPCEPTAVLQPQQPRDPDVLGVDPNRVEHGLRLRADRG
jgi:hypothetical protein